MIRDTLATFTTVEKSLTEITGLIEQRTFLVAEHSDRFAGFATYGPFRGGPGYVATAEHSVIVGASFRGSGVGRALMANLEANAGKDNIHTLIGAFHEAMGFHVAGRLSEAGQKNNQWLDLVLMQKILTPSV